MRKTIILLIGVIFIQGCASIKTKSDFTIVGDADPAREIEINKEYKKSKAIAEEVRLLINQIPEGIEYNDGIISISDGYNHDIIGSFKLLNNINVGLFCFSNYRSNTAKYFAYPQVILSYLTLTLWSSLSPTAWPFLGTRLKKVDAINDAKQLAHVAGGDLVIASYLFPDGQYVAGLIGWVVKVDPNFKPDEIKIKENIQLEGGTED
ncbi:MAG: hypothetical protein AB8B56_09090 [Crocinitomicaceae bacterium]